jgi:hypothetical protein
VSKLSRDKGARIEREIVVAHVGLGIKAERVPLSGASRLRPTQKPAQPVRWQQSDRFRNR